MADNASTAKATVTTPVATAATATSGTPAVALRALRKEFSGRPPVVAVNDIDLDIADGEFFSMLGPSGSGKTTVLRMIAGFEEPTSGVVQLAGVDVTGRAPYQRDVNTVFQDYALFPHMSVIENVQYGLRVKKVNKAEARTRAGEALDQVRLGDLGERRPAQLSGGQRQRVALARALVNQPKVLLLDEPLGALDLKLREQMQVELKSIQREVGITFLFVTHDQDEALTLSDRIAVFNNGRIEQVGSAAEIYEHPTSAFVAGFVGTSNLLEGAAAAAILGTAGRFAVRPEKVHISALGAHAEPAGDGFVRVTGTLAEVVYAGAVTRYVVDLATAGSPRLVALKQNGQDLSAATGLARGDRVDVSWRRDHLISVPAEPSNPTKPG